MTTRSGGRVYRWAPKPLRTGACPTCFREIAITTRGRRRRHADKDGVTCTGSGVLVGEPDISEQTITLGLVLAAMAESTVLAETTRPGLRLKPNGRCHECARPISGERRFCGPCLAKGRL